MTRSVIWSIALAVTSAATVTVLLASAEASRVVGYPLIEDGFYSLSIARQIGLGHGITIDGTTWTNGFQPLWVFVLAPLFWIVSGRRIAALRAVIVCSAVVWLLTAWLLGKLASRARPGSARAIRAWTIVLYLTSTTIFAQHFNGLETGLLLLMLAALGCATAHRIWSTARTLAVGVLAGLLVLARIDTGLFVVLLSASTLFFPRRHALQTRVRRTAAIVIGSAVISAPWWIYNVRRFGSLMPSSGSSEFDWHWRPGRALVLALYTAGHAVPLPVRHFSPSSYDWCAVAALIVVGAVAIARLRGRILVVAAARLDDHPLAPFTVALAVYTGLLIGAYALTPAWWMYERYTMPVVVLSVPALAIAAAHVFRERGLAVAAPVGVLCLILGVRANVRSPENGNFQAQLRLALDHVPGGAAVGAMQSGTLGYFRDRVVNLDGKVNAAALSARGRLGEYTRRAGVDWLVDWPGLLRSGFGSLDDWQFVARADVRGCESCRFVLYRRRARPANR